MKKVFNKINETGTMLVEAMAMLGLIAMVTPILYKKAAERTTELQDINASNQLRILADAMDSYIKDNFVRINEGETIVNSCHVGSVDYGSFTDATSVSFDISHLCEYLPYGFLKDGQTQDSKLFSSANPSYQVVLRKTTGTENDEAGNPVVVAETITGFLTAVPNEGEDFPSNRVSRIATMVGSNGGYVQDDGKIMGAQGIWSLDNDGELGLNLDPKTFVISSLQPISSQGLANEDVLHRKTERQNDYVLNSMETDLFMSYNDKNHNIRQVNQIIMSPQKEWMLGGDMNDFTRAVDDTPTMEYGQTYEPSLDYTLYIGEKGGAFMEGNLAALSSLFTVRSEEETDGGIKYYDTETTTDNTDPANPVTSTNKGANIFSVTTSKMEYGNIDENTAGVLLTVDKDGGSMDFESKTTSSAPDGSESTSSQKLISANASRVNVIDGALSVRNPGVAADGGKYDMYHTEQWPEQNAAPAVIVGGGEVHKGSYTTYTYNADGTPVVTNGIMDGADKTEGEHALTVNGPAFVKDSLKTAKLKAYNVDAAKLRGGTRYEDFNDVTEDSEFYLVAEQKSDAGGTEAEGRLMVGVYEDTPAAMNRYRLQIAEADGTSDDGVEIQSGIRMNHESGINLAAGDADGVVDVGLIEHDVTAKSSSADFKTADGQIKLGAFNAISLSTVDSTGNFIDKSVVSIQDDMLRAYNENTGTGDTLVSTGYLDSVTDNARFLSRTYENINHDSLYARDLIDDEGLFALGDMDFTVSEDVLGDDDMARPVLDVKAKRKDLYTSTRVAGGFAVFDYDASSATDDGAGNAISAEYPSSGAEKGNPALYMDKGDFQILATVKNETDSIEKGDIILQVDNNSDTGVIADNDDRGSVYIRKGAINIGGKDFAGSDDGEYARWTNADIATDSVATGDGDSSAQGYIAADRFIAHTRPLDHALSASSESLSGNTIGGINSAGAAALVTYDKYEINPAYTSVMHDIKLTTRGGARLSDILPDFINKGIYVVDNTFKEDTNWVGGTPGAQTEWGEGTSAEAYTSAYLGYVPSPTCPQGYSKVITINPSGWAMAQAGTPVNNGGSLDIATHNNPFLYWYTQDQQLRTNVEEVEPVNPLTFQKSTWLRAMVMPVCNGDSGDGKFQMNGKCKADDADSFTGWGTVLGFVYPEAYYKEFLDWDNDGLAMGGNANQGSVDGGSSPTGNDTIYWNLFPVQYRQLEAYVTVYCYFNRKIFNDSSMVDTTYDQLKGTTRNYWEKGDTDYSRRLNDPNLKYTDPW